MLLLALLGCTGTVDLDLLVVDGEGLAVSAARADVDQIVLTSCKGREEAYTLGYAFDLRSPSPVRVSDRKWCGAEVRFLDTRRPLVVRGRTDGGTDFDALLTPSTAKLSGVEVGGRGDELVLLLYADRMLPASDVDALASEDGYTRIDGASPLGTDATSRLPGALSLVSLPSALELPGFPYPAGWFVEPQPIETAWPIEETGDTGPWVDTSVTWYTDTGMGSAPSGGCGSSSASSEETGVTDDTDDPSPVPDTDTGDSDGGGGGCSCDDDDTVDTADTAESASLGSRGGSFALLLLFWRKRRS